MSEHVLLGTLLFVLLTSSIRDCASLEIASSEVQHNSTRPVVQKMFSFRGTHSCECITDPLSIIKLQ